MKGIEVIAVVVRFLVVVAIAVLSWVFALRAVLQSSYGPAVLLCFMGAVATVMVAIFVWQPLRDSWRRWQARRVARRGREEEEER